jgi:hypothetical protein
LFDNSDLTSTRRVLRAATILWQFLRIGYGPDLGDCLAAIDSVVPPDYSTLLQEAISPDLFALEPGSEPPDAARAQEVESGGRRTRRDIIQHVALLGSDFPKLPLARLRPLALSGHFISDNDFTRADIDDTRRVSFRWFRHDPSSGELRARILARALAISIDELPDRLGTLTGFAWRSSVATRNHLHQQGTRGAADIRIAGSVAGLWEVAIASPETMVAQEILAQLISSLSAAASPNS